jgi:hypothetical protein
MSFVTADQLVCHAVGDYVFQSDWMANEKTKSTWPAVAHAITYTLPFILLTQDLYILNVIAVTHAIIDRLRLARYVCWLKNFMSPRKDWWHPWKECVGTGYHEDRPPWLAVWLMIITDNIMHVAINAACLKWIPGHLV